MPEGPSSRRGFTLLEVLVALAILSGTLVLAHQVMTEAIFAEDRSERWTTAAFLGESLLRDTLSPFPEIAEKDGKFPPPYGDYSWKIAVKETLHSDAREVDVTVTWGEGERTESVALAGIAIK